MRAMPSFTSRTVPTSSTSSSWRSAASISRRRMSLISPGRSVVSVAIRSGRKAGRCEGSVGACENYHKAGRASNSSRLRTLLRPRCVRMGHAPATDAAPHLGPMAAGTARPQSLAGSRRPRRRVVRSSGQAPAAKPRSSPTTSCSPRSAVGEHIADGYRTLHRRRSSGNSYRRAKRALLRLETQLAIAGRRSSSPRRRTPISSTRSQQRRTTARRLPRVSRATARRARARPATADVDRRRRRPTSPRLRPCPFVNRSTRSTVRRRASDAGLFRRRAARCSTDATSEAKSSMSATSRTS